MTASKKAKAANSGPMRENIDAVAKLEHESVGNRTHSERIGERLAKAIGGLAFLCTNLALIAAWVVWNSRVIAGAHAFDPFPFGILAMTVSTEGVILTVFVLMSQNRMMRQSERRSHLDLQVGILAEQELTAALVMLRKLCEHSGVAPDAASAAVEDFAKATDIKSLDKELTQKLPKA
jgi:uncharacterized membrane protein